MAPPAELSNAETSSALALLELLELRESSGSSSESWREVWMGRAGAVVSCEVIVNGLLWDGRLDLDFGALREREKGLGRAWVGG